MSTIDLSTITKLTLPDGTELTKLALSDGSVIWTSGGSSEYEITKDGDTLTIAKAPASVDTEDPSILNI